MTIKQQFENGFAFFMWNGEQTEYIVDAETIFVRDETARRYIARLLGYECAMPKAEAYPALYRYDDRRNQGFVELSHMGTIIESIAKLSK